MKKSGSILAETVARLEKEGYKPKPKTPYYHAPDILKILSDEIKKNSFPNLEIDPITEKNNFVIEVFEAETTNPLLEISAEDGVYIIETPKGAFSHLEWSEQVMQVLHNLSESKPLRELVKNFKRFNC